MWETLVNKEGKPALDGEWQRSQFGYRRTARGRELDRIREAQTPVGIDGAALAGGCIKALVAAGAIATLVALVVLIWSHV
jgi:hypothetical protein